MELYTYIASKGISESVDDRLAIFIHRQFHNLLDALPTCRSPYP
jgi:hypothetical protein